MRPTSFIPRLISELELDHDIQRRANELAARAEETALSNGCQSTNDVRVQWAADGVDAAWYAVTDAGSIEGGPGRVDDPDVTFTGDVGTPSGMLGDDGLEPQQAFVDGAFQMNGDVHGGAAVRVDDGRRPAERRGDDRLSGRPRRRQRRRSGRLGPAEPRARETRPVDRGTVFTS